MNPMSKFTTPRFRRNEAPDVKTKDFVSVFCRLHPLKNDQESTCIKLLSPTTLAWTTPVESKLARKEVHSQFKHIFTAFATQKEVFDHVAYPLVKDLLKGKNGLLFTYGVTGSGKTYTLTGTEQNPGIIPKCIYTVFNTISQFQASRCVIKSDGMNGFEGQSLEDAVKDQRRQLKVKTSQKRTRKMFYVNDGCKVMDINENNLYAVFVSYIEIYNNTVFDLLEENTGKKSQGKILREDSQKNMYVNNVIETEVKSAKEAFELFNMGQKRKRMGNTVLNGVSSRSHSIFNIRVVQFQQLGHNKEGVPINTEPNLLKVAQLSLVDLAGTERNNRTHNTGQLLKEASQINNSLLSLRTCLEILKEKQLTGSNRIVPYRNCRLTLLFKTYFEGEGRVEMIVCVKPSGEDFDENIQVMKFAETTQDVKVARAKPKFTPLKKTIQRKSRTPGAIRINEIFSMSPQLLDINLFFNSLEESQETLEKCIKVMRANKSELDKKVTHFRKHLRGVQQETILVKSENKNLKTLVETEKQKRAITELKLAASEARNRELRQILDSEITTPDIEVKLMLESHMQDVPGTSKQQTRRLVGTLATRRRSRSIGQVEAGASGYRRR